LDFFLPHVKSPKRPYVYKRAGYPPVKVHTLVFRPRFIPFAMFRSLRLTAGIHATDNTAKTLFRVGDFFREWLLAKLARNGNKITIRAHVGRPCFSTHRLRGLRRYRACGEHFLQISAPEADKFAANLGVRNPPLKYPRADSAYLDFKKRRRFGDGKNIPYSLWDCRALLDVHFCS
jgi:hypothetical protein